MKSAQNALVKSFKLHARKHGFDICTPFSLATYNNTVDEKLKRQPFASTRRENQDKTLCFLLGNTRFAWPHMLRYIYDNSPENEPISNPIDSWARDTVRLVIQEFEEEHASELKQETENTKPAVYYSFETGPGRLIAMQRLAHAIGLGHYDQSFFTVVNDEYGPWISLRSVVMYDMDFDDKLTPEECENDTITSPATPCLARGCAPHHLVAFDSLMAGKSSRQVLCDIKAHFCGETEELKKPKASNWESLDASLAIPDVIPFCLPAQSSNIKSHSSLCEKECKGIFRPLDVPDLVDAQWDSNSIRWLLNRSVCGLGENYRFPPAMALYHYAHDRHALQLELENFREQIQKN